MAIGGISGSSFQGYDYSSLGPVTSYSSQPPMYSKDKIGYPMDNSLAKTGSVSGQRGFISSVTGRVSNYFKRIFLAVFNKDLRSNSPRMPDRMGSQGQANQQEYLWEDRVSKANEEPPPADPTLNDWPSDASSDKNIKSGDNQQAFAEPSELGQLNQLSQLSQLNQLNQMTRSLEENSRKAKRERQDLNELLGQDDEEELEDEGFSDEELPKDETAKAMQGLIRSSVNSSSLSVNKDKDIQFRQLMNQLSTLKSSNDPVLMNKLANMEMSSLGALENG